LTLILTVQQEASVRAHAERDYPDECCGVFIGEIVGAGNYVSEVIALRNHHEDGGRRRFRITGDDLLQVEKIARLKKQSIIGFYHSHPNVPAIPSQYDKDHAWEAYSYLIVEVSEGKVVVKRSWKLDLDADGFNEENVMVNPCLLRSSISALPADADEI
jgi:proteasome lid subunit RPN8/RPN11